MSLKVAVEWLTIMMLLENLALLLFYFLFFWFFQGIIVKAWAGNYLFFWISTEITNCVNI